MDIVMANKVFIDRAEEQLVEWPGIIIIIIAPELLPKNAKKQQKTKKNLQKSKKNVEKPRKNLRKTQGKFKENIKKTLGPHSVGSLLR